MTLDQLKRFRRQSHFDQFMHFFKSPNTFQLFGEKLDLRPMVLVDPDPQELLKRNNEGYGIFICINTTDGKGRKASNVKRVRYVFCDLDGQSPSKMLDDLPNFAVQSSLGKFHGYFRVDDEFPLEGFKHVQKAIAHKYGSDPSVIDLSRVMRVPGFYHHKADPFPTTMVFVNSEKVEPLSYAECLEKWPPKPKKQWSAKKQFIHKVKEDADGLDVGYSVPELLDRYGWVYQHGRGWCRPGKASGISGELHEDGLFYCYTSSTCLKPNSQNDAFELMAQYEYGGDKRKLALELLEKKR